VQSFTGTLQIAHNVLGIAEGGALNHRSLIEKQMFNMSTEDKLKNVNPTFGNTVLPAVVGSQTKYRTIVADPPWKYGKWGKADPKTRPNCKEYNMPYETMSIEEIKALNVSDLADENCELYLWTTQKYLPDAFEVLKAWGFKYCQTLTWCKTPRGKGQGGVYCPTNEFLILGRKGKMPKVERVDTTWFHTKRPHNAHSKKPEFFQELIETVSDAPRLEMFARRKRIGWDIWGNELENDVELETSANNGR